MYDDTQPTVASSFLFNYDMHVTDATDEQILFFFAIRFCFVVCQIVELYLLLNLYPAFHLLLVLFVENRRHIY